jgi:membrane protease subunit HflC
MKIPKFLLPAVVLIAVFVFQSLFIVQEINQAIVLQFGDPKKIISKAGLNFKLPFIQNVVYLDKRILNLDNAPEEVIAADQKRLIVDAIARFKICRSFKILYLGWKRESREVKTFNNYQFKNKRCT